MTEPRLSHALRFNDDNFVTVSSELTKEDLKKLHEAYLSDSQIMAQTNRDEGLSCIRVTEARPTLLEGGQATHTYTLEYCGPA